jgi:hypothetical protein
VLTRHSALVLIVQGPAAWACRDSWCACPAYRNSSEHRIVKFVEEQARTWPAGSPEFDHYTPSTYLTEHRTAFLKKVPETELEAALVRFEKLLADVNALLPQS